MRVADTIRRICTKPLAELGFEYDTKMRGRVVFTRPAGTGTQHVAFESSFHARQALRLKLFTSEDIFGVEDRHLVAGREREAWNFYTDQASLEALIRELLQLACTSGMEWFDRPREKEPADG